MKNLITVREIENTTKFNAGDRVLLSDGMKEIEVTVKGFVSVESHVDAHGGLNKGIATKMIEVERDGEIVRVFEQELTFKQETTGQSLADFLEM